MSAIFSIQDTRPADRIPAPKTQRTPAQWMRWAGRIASGLAAAFLIFDGAIKVLAIGPAVEGTAQLGYPPSVVVPLGIVVLVGVALYLVPRTSPLGALYLTGFLGGAVATHVRVENPLFSHTLFPVYVAALLWLGLWLRDARVRALFPLRSPESR